MPLTTIQYVTAAIIPVLLAITLHEVAHGYVAHCFGDASAKMLGRLTLNPLKHIDIIGTVIIPVILLALSGFVFGWAKPVPINPRNLKNPRYNMMAVAAAGPLANGAMALMWAVILKCSFLFLANEAMIFVFLKSMAVIGIRINLVLMVLNLVPIPPLDGSKIIMGLLPGSIAYKFSLLEPYGFLIILALLYLGVLNIVMGPILAMLTNGISIVFGF